MVKKSTQVCYFGIPAWVWYMGGASIVLWSGKIASNINEKKQLEKKGSGTTTVDEKKKKPTTESYSTSDLITLSMKMMEIAKVAEKISYDNYEQVKGVINSVDLLEETIKEDPVNLKDPEKEFEKNKIVKTEMLDGLSVIRGTLKQKIEEDSLMEPTELKEILDLLIGNKSESDDTKNLDSSDKSSDKSSNNKSSDTSRRKVYTFDQPEYWEQKYNSSGLQTREWYFKTEEQLDSFQMNEARQWPDLVVDQDGKFRNLVPLKNETYNPDPNAKNLTTLLEVFGEEGLNLPRDSKILMLGCGNSALGPLMVKKLGYANILNIDISESLISQMKNYYHNPENHKVRSLKGKKKDEERELENMDDKYSYDNSYDSKENDHVEKDDSEKKKNSKEIDETVMGESVFVVDEVVIQDNKTEDPAITTSSDPAASASSIVDEIDDWEPIPSMEELQKMYKFEIADAKSLPYGNDTYDIVIEKGTYDALEYNRPLQLAVMQETRRVLKEKGGILISISLQHVVRENHLDIWGDNCKEIILTRATEKMDDATSFTMLHWCKY